MRSDMKDVVINVPRNKKVKNRSLFAADRRVMPVYYNGEYVQTVHGEGTYEYVEGGYEYEGPMPNGKVGKRAVKYVGRERDKYPSDRLAPLRRFLQSNAGRKWDDVYREFCAVTDVRSLRGWHVKDHLAQFVKPRGDNYEGGYGFTVDVEGVLRYKPYRFKFPKSKPTQPVLVIRGRMFTKWKDVWYEVFGKKSTEIKVADVPLRDTFGMSLLSWYEVKRHYGIDVVLMSKVTCSKQTIKQFGLNELV